MQDHRGLLGRKPLEPGGSGLGGGRMCPQHPSGCFPSQTRREETQVSSQLLRLPKREMHPHDLDL